jgi:hypothetical protein
MMYEGEEMVDRRSVLKLGAASIAGTLISMPAPALGAAWADSPNPLYRAVFDGRFEEGLAFADELQRRRVVTFSTGHDIAKLWYDDLQLGLSQRPAPIAGLTDRVTLFCLEELARSAGMRVLYRVDHIIDERGNVEHDAVGPASIVAATRKLTAKSGFGRAMAALARHFDVRERQDTAALKRTGPFSPVNKLALVSWVIA